MTKVAAQIPSTGFSMEAKSDKKADIGYLTLSGYIASFDYEDEYFKATTFLEAFNKLKKEHSHIHINIVNLYGGSIYEGIPVYNALKEEAEVKITGKVDGLAASMGSVIALAIAPENLEMGKMARLMIHRAKSGSYGTGDELMAAGKATNDLEEDLISIYSERSVFSTEEVKSKWMDGVDHYINATDAKKYGFVGQTVESTIKKSPAKAMMTNPKDVFNFYNSQIINQKTDSNDMKNLALFAAALVAFNPKFSIDSPSEEEVLAEMKAQLKAGKDAEAALKDAQDALKEANDKLAESETAAIKSLIDGAIAENKIQESQRESIEAMASKDFENAKAFLAAQTPRTSLSATLKGGTKTPKPGEAEMTFSEWRKKDAKGLAQMKKTDPERYQELYDAQYGS